VRGWEGGGGGLELNLAQPRADAGAEEGGEGDGAVDGRFGCDEEVGGGGGVEGVQGDERCRPVAEDCAGCYSLSVQKRGIMAHL
jgi:hypothetical protein